MDYNNLIKLQVAGLSYNHQGSGIYALILQEDNGARRLQIVIGQAEAQSIECKLQEILPPRPLTHDLAVNIMRVAGLSLNAVVIKRLNNGIFAADLHLAEGERNIIIDARSSDAIALALRTNTPIYAEESLLETADNVNKPSSTRIKSVRVGDTAQNSLSHKGMAELEQMMEKAVEKEHYEEASRIKAEIDRRKQEMDSSDELL